MQDAKALESNFAQDPMQGKGEVGEPNVYQHNPQAPKLDSK